MPLAVDRCDSCHALLDPVADVNRWRHRGCPPPPLPLVALDVLARINRVRQPVEVVALAGGTQKGCEPDEVEVVDE